MVDFSSGNPYFNRMVFQKIGKPLCHTSAILGLRPAFLNPPSRAHQPALTLFGGSARREKEHNIVMLNF